MSQFIESIFQAFDDKDFARAYHLLEQEEDSIESQHSQAYFWHRNNLVYYFTFLKEYAKAFEVCQQNISLAKELEDKELEHVSLHHTAMVLREQGNFQEASDYIGLEKTIIDTYFSENAGAYSANFYESGYLSYLGGDLKSAKEDLRLALKYGEQSGDIIAEACAYRALGEVTADKNFFVKAIDLFQEAGDQIGAEEVRLLLKNND